jgi:hypothetical protein
VAVDDSWYELVEGQDLEQGDLIDRCPVYVPEYSTNVIDEAEGEKTLSYQVSAREYIYDAVIVTQSCDLKQRKVRRVLLCVCWSLEEFIGLSDQFRSRKAQDKIRQNQMPSYHMLDVCGLEKVSRGIQVIDFRDHFTMPYDFLTQFAAVQGKRLRLRSPYKEHMSHRFGNFWSRVGLPKDISPFVS